jgi:hypothetical protein
MTPPSTAATPRRSAWTGRTLALELDVDATSGYGATYQAPWLPLTVMVWADF